MCESVQPEQSRSSNCFAVGYLEGISLICARRLRLNSTKMEKLVLTLKNRIPVSHPRSPALRTGIRQPQIRLIFFFPEKKFWSWVKEGGKCAWVIFTAPLVVVILVG